MAAGQELERRLAKLVRLRVREELLVVGEIRWLDWGLAEASNAASRLSTEPCHSLACLLTESFEDVDRWMLIATMLVLQMTKA